MRKREMFDGYTVDAYQARFSGTIDVEDEFAESLYTGRVTVWLLAARNGEAQFKETADAESVIRKNVQKIEMAIPLDGQMRDEAIIYLSHAGTQGGVSFKRDVSQESEEIDRLAGYLLRNFGQEIGREASESAVDVALRLLDRVLVEEVPTIEIPSDVDPETGEVHPVPLIEVLANVTDDDVTVTVGSIDDRRYSDEGDGESVDRGGLQVAKFDEGDGVGEVVTVGSVYGDASSSTRDILDKAFQDF